MTGVSGLASVLAPRLRALWGAEAEVTDVRPLPGGASRESWGIRVRTAADRAMQVHGGLGYSRHEPFEHIYRHHRRYRITEGTEEIQMRRVAGYLFGFIKPDTLKGVTG